MRTRPVILAAAALLTPAALAAPADAARSATAAEKAAVLRDLGAAPDAGACNAVFVSTAAGGEGWARVDGVTPDPPGCIGFSMRYAVVRSTAGPNGPWAVKIQGRTGDTAPPCVDSGVPDAVGADLGGCAPGAAGGAPAARSRTTIGCNGPPRSRESFQRRRPSRCIVLVPFSPTLEGVDLRRVRWSSWGRSTAKGTARARIITGGELRGGTRDVRVTASRLGSVGGRRAYRRLRVRGPGLSRTYTVGEPQP